MTENTTKERTGEKEDGTDFSRRLPDAYFIRDAPDRGRKLGMECLSGIVSFESFVCFLHKPRRFIGAAAGFLSQRSIKSVPHVSQDKGQ